MKKRLIIGIILIMGCLGLAIYQEIENENYINIYDMTNKDLKNENVKVYLDATFVAGTIQNYTNESFYVMFGDGVQYIVYMNNNLSNKINKYLLDNPNNSYHIEGVTKKIPQKLEESGRKFVKMWLDTNHHHDNNEEITHSHDITVDEFYHYFSHIYLDCTIKDNVTIKIIIYITLVMGSLMILSFIIKKYQLL